MTNADFRHNEFEIMQDTWAAYKKHYIPPEQDEGWDRLADDFGAVIQKYSGSKLCEALVIAFTADIERRKTHG